MKQHNVKLLFCIAIISGLFLAIGYVNPFEPHLLLSEMTLQLSGSRGNFALGISMPELISFAVLLVPDFVFETYFGTMLYRHFCTASIYVFSRYPQKMWWYSKELCFLVIHTFVYQIILLATVIIVTTIRYQLIFDHAGTILLIYHIFLRTLWTFSMTLLINIISIYFEGNSAFFFVVGGQLISISLLTLIKKHEIALYGNLVAYLVLGWHSSNLEVINQVLSPPFQGLYLKSSLSLNIGLSILISIFGAVLVKKHDFIVSNLEERIR